MTNRVAAWRPTIPGVAEVFHAHMVDHAYPMHIHDTWTVLLVDQGAISFDLDRHRVGTGRGLVTILPPGVAHDGRSVHPEGFRKRVVYLDGDAIPSSLVGRTVDEPNISDPSLASQLDRLHRALTWRGDDLAAESALAIITGSLVEKITRREARPRPTERSTAHLLRQLLDEHTIDPITLASAAATLERNPTHLIRSFKQEFGLTPHAYLVGRRIDIARRLLLAGLPVAEVAVAAGFYDQAHLTRHFRAHVATTPGRFRSSR